LVAANEQTRSRPIDDFLQDHADEVFEFAHIPRVVAPFRDRIEFIQQQHQHSVYALGVIEDMAGSLCQTSFGAGMACE